MIQFQNIHLKFGILILDYVGLPSKLESHSNVSDDHLKTKYLEHELKLNNDHP